MSKDKKNPEPVPEGTMEKVEEWVRRVRKDSPYYHDTTGFRHKRPDRETTNEPAATPHDDP